MDTLARLETRPRASNQQQVATRDVDRRRWDTGLPVRLDEVHLSVLDARIEYALRPIRRMPAVDTMYYCGSYPDLRCHPQWKQFALQIRM